METLEQTAPTVAVRMLGPFELRLSGERPGAAELGGLKPKQLLELLLLERGRVVPKDGIAELLWGERLPQRVAATIESYVSVLRRRRLPARERACPGRRRPLQGAAAARRGERGGRAPPRARGGARLAAGGVLGAWDEHAVHRSLPRTLAPALRAAGFADVRAQAHAFATIEFDADSYGAALVPLIGDFAAGRAGVDESEAAAWVAEQRALGERGEFYFASTQFCFTAVKPAG